MARGIVGTFTFYSDLGTISVLPMWIGVEKCAESQKIDNVIEFHLALYLKIYLLSILK